MSAEKLTVYTPESDTTMRPDYACHDCPLPQRPADKWSMSEFYDNPDNSLTVVSTFHSAEAAFTPLNADQKFQNDTFYDSMEFTEFCAGPLATLANLFGINVKHNLTEDNHSALTITIPPTKAIQVQADRIRRYTGYASDVVIVPGGEFSLTVLAGSLLDDIFPLATEYADRTHDTLSHLIPRMLTTPGLAAAISEQTKMIISNPNFPGLHGALYGNALRDHLFKYDYTIVMGRKFMQYISEAVTQDPEACSRLTEYLSGYVRPSVAAAEAPKIIARTQSLLCLAQK